VCSTWWTAHTTMHTWLSAAQRKAISCKQFHSQPTHSDMCSMNCTGFNHPAFCTPCIWWLVASIFSGRYFYNYKTMHLTCAVLHLSLVACSFMTSIPVSSGNCAKWQSTF
jgi:hypothetical protein